MFHSETAQKLPNVHLSFIIPLPYLLKSRTDKKAFIFGLFQSVYEFCAIRNCKKWKYFVNITSGLILILVL